MPDGDLISGRELEYAGLVRTARRVATELVAVPRPAELSGRGAFILRHAEHLAASGGTEAGEDLNSGVAVECLELLAESWPRVMGGDATGETIFLFRPDLWARLMVEWPMGAYAQLAAEFLVESGELGGRVLELGAGIGGTTRRLTAHLGDGFVRTDLNAGLLRLCPAPGATAQYDFNEPGEWRDLDVVFAVNAVHCARDPGRTLGYLAEMLRPGGWCVLAEGSPATRDGLPWALTYFFGLFDGWWDVGGFRPRSDWLADLRAAGFAKVGTAPLRAGDHDLGGLVWGRR